MTGPQRNVRGAKKLSGEIATSIYDAYKRANGVAPSWSWALVRDIAERMLGVCGDQHQVELVLDTILQRDEGDLEWVTTAQFMYFSARLGYPRGSWRYALWAHRCEPGKLRDSIDYWLTEWNDADGNPETIKTVKAALERLQEYSLTEELSW